MWYYILIIVGKRGIYTLNLNRYNFRRNVVRNFNRIDSNLEALKLKGIEKKIYENAAKEDFIIPKVVPFKGVNTDMLYIRNNSLVFIKIMETTDELFSFLDEEILEIMQEEYNVLCRNMKERFPEIRFEYVFAMPYIEYIEDRYGMDDFVDQHVLIGDELEVLLKDDELFNSIFSETNDEIQLSMFIYQTCSEYFALTDQVNLNKFLKKISFSYDKLNYKLAMMDNEQITNIASIDYGNHLITGGSGTGKSSVLLGRLIKLSKIYPHHEFLLLTFTKQQCNKYKEALELLGVDSSNIRVHTFSSFIFKVAKANELVINYDMLKKNFDKSFLNIMKQIQNTMKNKKMFKGIFIDEGENFNEDEIKLIHEFLYSTKNIFNICICKSYNINNNLNIYKCRMDSVGYNGMLRLTKNYRQSKEITEFINSYCGKSNAFINEIREVDFGEVYMKSDSVYSSNESVNIVRVEDLDDQINSVIWEVQHYINDLGYKPDEIAIVYPYNKKRLKNGKVIYFQYMLRKSLEDANINYVFADDTITDITPKNGVTISNIYSIKALSYKVVVMCELEMLYNQNIEKDSHDYQVNDFVGDLNKVYTAMTRAQECLSIVLSYTEQNSDIIKLLIE